MTLQLFLLPLIFGVLTFWVPPLKEARVQKSAFYDFFLCAEKFTRKRPILSNIHKRIFRPLLVS